MKNRKNYKMHFLITTVITLILIITGCNKDDDSDYIIDRCEGVMQIDEVTISDVTVQPVDNDSLQGYIVKAKVTNNTNQNIQGGKPTIVLRVKGIPYSISGSAICGNIEANSICLYDHYSYISANESIDFNVIIDCFYYTL